MEEETPTSLTAIVMCNYHKLRVRSSFASWSIYNEHRQTTRKRILLTVKLSHPRMSYKAFINLHSAHTRVAAGEVPFPATLFTTS